MKSRNQLIKRILIDVIIVGLGRHKLYYIKVRGVEVKTQVQIGL